LAENAWGGLGSAAKKNLLELAYFFLHSGTDIRSGSFDVLSAWAFLLFSQAAGSHWLMQCLRDNGMYRYTRPRSVIIDYLLSTV
jgi:hypothetical protein